MKKLLLPFMLLFVLGVVYVINGTDVTEQTAQKTVTEKQKTAIQEKIAKMPQEAKPSIQYMHQILANQVTGEIDPADMINEYKAVRANKAITNKTSALDQDVEWRSLGPNNVGGRTRGFLIDREDDQTLYAGSVSGGLFKSTNGGTDWSVLQSSIEAGCVGVTTIAQADNGDIYIGTGSSYEGIGGGPSGSTSMGTGVFKTTDGGETFDLLIETIPTDFLAVNRIQVYERGGSTYVYAATSNGLRLSKDAGDTWETPKDDSGNALSSSLAHDIDIDPEGNVYCPIGPNFWKSTDGETFSKLNGNGDLPINIPGARKLVAVSQSDPNYLYFASSTGGNEGQNLEGIWQSKDGGESFTLLAENSQFLDLNTQGAYDFCLDVDPNNPDLDYKAEDTSVILLRVMDAAPLPNDAEALRLRVQAAQQTEATPNDHWDTKMDPSTASLLSYAGVRCRVIGTFFIDHVQNEEADDVEAALTLRFGSDISN